MTVNRSQHDREAGFREGALWAASLARDVLRGVKPDPTPGGFNRRSYLAATRTLQVLVDEIEAGVRDGSTPPPAYVELVLDTSHALDAMGVLPVVADRVVAIAKGYTGDECGDCGSFSMVRNGTCLKCENCGSTTGCS